jgi:hypothetical protein
VIESGESPVIAPNPPWGTAFGRDDVAWTVGISDLSTLSDEPLELRIIEAAVVVAGGASR